jgi:hypothetical protein
LQTWWAFVAVAASWAWHVAHAGGALFTCTVAWQETQLECPVRVAASLASPAWQRAQNTLEVACVGALKSCGTWQLVHERVDA